MASGTVISRVTGVARDMAMTAALGFYVVSDAYSLGNTLPNIIYILVVGGALNAVFVPQLVRKMKDDPDGGAGYIDRLLTLTMTVLLILSVVAVLIAPLIVDLYATSQYSAGQRDLAIAFARLCLPQIFFYGVYTLLSQVLNARGKFGAPMFAPIVNNFIAIATFVLFIIVAGTGAASDGALSPDQVTLLGLGTTLGVALQALILLPVLRRTGYLWHPRFDWRGAGLGKVGTLASWTIGLVLVNQAAYVVITRLATLANVNASDVGNVAAGLTTYQKAHLIFVLPHSVITVSIVTAMLPALSRVAHAGDFKQVGRDIASVMRLVGGLMVPLSAILMVLAPALAIMMFGYGAATVAQASVTGSIVTIFVIGLVPFTLFYVVLRGFYALEDTRTPFWASVAFNIVMLGLSVPLFYLVPDGKEVAGLALGYALAYWFAFALVWYLLSRRLGGLETRRTLQVLIRMIVAGLVALAIMYGSQALFGRLFVMIFGEMNRIGLILDIAVVASIGVAAYLAAAWSMRITEVSEAMSLVTRRLRRRGATT